MRARFVFYLNIGVELLEQHFVTEARAYLSHPSHRTTRIDLILERNQLQYRPYDVTQAGVNANP